MATSSIQYEDKEQASEFLRLTLAKFSQLNLSATPVNYALLYTYVAGTDLALNEQLDSLIKQEGGLQDDQAESLFQKHICSSGDQVDNQMRQELLHMMAPIIGSLVDIAGKTAVSNDELEKHIKALAKTSDPKQTIKVAADILSETRNFVSEARNFENNLNQTTQEIRYLRDELETAKKEATIDALTGLSNRRSFDRAILDAQQACAEENENFCLLIVDIDHFKQVNDNHGHLIGDKVLIGVARLMMKNMRGGDFLARFGGEEFAIILRDTPITGAFSVAENLRKAIKRLQLKHLKTGELIEDVTVSIGVANYRKGEPLEEFIARCDKALYRAKTTGRNRSVIAD
ncbi:MAG: GGDEF domain-containing protein [Gammaproteobacteria bacterium]|nr:GGDEF domain-containing protein [Gammaproteobacteria bacterium]